MPAHQGPSSGLEPSSGPAEVGTPSPVPRRSEGLRWRVVDVVVAAVLGIVFGLVFWFWDGIGSVWFGLLDKTLGGLGGLAIGVWLLGGVVGGLIIRKPGAAFVVELVAALVSTVGSQWGISTLYSGVAQGLGTELIFAAFLYARSGVVVSALAGMGSAALEWVLELFTVPSLKYGGTYLVTYLGCVLISGCLLAGVLGWALTRVLAMTGVLDRFPVGRARRARI